MKIVNLGKSAKVYCANRYLVLGSWNQLDAVNTLVDVGTNGDVIDDIAGVSTGVGKRPVEQVVLTHGHFDHSGGLKDIIKRYNPRVYAFTKIEGVTDLLKDGQNLLMGDRIFEVIHVPGHSNDSICLYCREDKVLFSGDTSINIRTPGGVYHSYFVKIFERIVTLDIEIIYSGHDNPVTEYAKDMLLNTLRNIKKSQIIYTDNSM
ncbi:MAG: MBL fold metallo-hydrolase [Candidatus Eremiobacterota bacterium]